MILTFFVRLQNTKLLNVCFVIQSNILYSIVGGEKMGITKPTSTFRFDEKLISKLKEYAIKDNRSYSNFVETILKEYVKKRESKND